VTRHWQRITPLTVALLPLSALFFIVSALRRLAYRRRWLSVARLPVPVIVVGNITAGGTGKTPLVLWLAQFLREHGFHPGIVSRGYRGTAREPQAVNASSDARICGDEPVLLARRSGCPLWIGRDRAAAARALLAVHPQCDVMLSDDGLQHYRLGRDVEIAVIDGARGFGNGFPLPAGPLREPSARLAAVDAVVVHRPDKSGTANFGDSASSIAMTLAGRTFRNLLNPACTVDAEHFIGQRLHAVAGIGEPQRFFRHLTRLGLTFAAHAFPDHHAYQPADLRFSDCDAIVMTEKDAVKCAEFCSERCWTLPVDAEVDPRLGDILLHKLRKRA
jgi:tetraacyldisaccharide 4'-kinase